MPNTISRRAFMTTRRHYSPGMDFPVSMGGYRYAEDPADAIVIHGTFPPTVPNAGLSGRAQPGRMSIANSDASAYATVNGATDAADRAVREQAESA